LGSGFLTRIPTWRVDNSMANKAMQWTRPFFGKRPMKKSQTAMKCQLAQLGTKSMSHCYGVLTFDPEWDEILTYGGMVAPAISLGGRT
jgi:hypothetical protein